MSSREPRSIRLVEDRWSTLRHVIEAIAIVAAGVWAFYTFFYQEKIKPAGEAPALTPTIEISRLGRDPRREILRISTTYHNVGKTQIDIAAEAVNVWGIRYGDHDRVEIRRTGQTRIYRDTMPEVSTRLIVSSAQLRQAAKGGIRGFRNVIEPGAATTVANVIALPRGRYDLLHAQIVAVPVKLNQSNVPVELIGEKSGGTFLRPDPSQAFEDDNDTYFALTP